SLVPCSSLSAVARSLIPSQRHGLSLIFSIRAVAHSPLHRACSLILEPQHASAAAATLGFTTSLFSPLCSSFSLGTLIFVLLPPPLPTPLSLTSCEIKLVKLVVDKGMTVSCERSVLYPKHGENLHCFTAITPCVVLDILSPPYREDEGRKYTYYHDYPYSTFSTQNGPKICDSEKEEYAWL
ncbi:hypothetical protein S83_054457, partial [Arachis hypogaea]